MGSKKNVSMAETEVNFKVVETADVSAVAAEEKAEKKVNNLINIMVIR